MTLHISFIGHHNSGKTTLIRQVLAILVERGYRVGAVKHAPRLEGVDAADSDSQLLREAGAEQTLLISEDTLALFWDADSHHPVDQVVKRLFADYDIVLVEGFKHGPFPKIEIYSRSRNQAEPLAGEIEVIAVVTKDKVALPDTVERLSPQDPEGIAIFIEDMLRTDSAT